MTNLTESLEQFEAERGNPVILVGASWRDDTATDLDGEAARGFLRLFDELDRPETLTLVLVARGGHASFVDAVARSMRATGTTLELAVPTLVTGVGGLLALAADRLLLHHHGGIGAYDAGPLRADVLRLDHDLIDDVPALGGIHYGDNDWTLPARLAAGMRERRLARALGDRLTVDDARRNGLSHVRLGTAHGLGPTELAELGFEVESTDSDALWNLFLAVEDALGILTKPTPRYTESDLGDEVEFEPAMGLLSAVIANRSTAFEHELDTGRPDPDTGRFAGAWNW